MDRLVPPRTNERTYGRTNERTNEQANENLAFFSIFGGALRAAAKNRKKCLTKKLGIFFDFWRRATHRRQKSKKMLNENLDCNS